MPELGQALGKRVNEMLYLYRGLPLRVGEMGAPDFTDRRPGGPSAEPRREVPEEGPCARGLCFVSFLKGRLDAHENCHYREAKCCSCGPGRCGVARQEAG